MSITTLTKTIRHLPPKEKVRLFDHLKSALENYLLTKIASERFKKARQKRIPWETLKP